MLTVPSTLAPPPPQLVRITHRKIAPGRYPRQAAPATNKNGCNPEEVQPSDVHAAMRGEGGNSLEIKDISG